MHPALVRATRSSITHQIEKLKKELTALQESCTHPRVSKENKGNTGNYDPSADCYWTEFTCPDCGKWWTEEGSK